MVLVAGAFLDEMLTQILDAKFTKEGIRKNCPRKTQIAVCTKNYSEARGVAFIVVGKSDGLPCLWYNQTTRIRCVGCALEIRNRLPIPALKLH